MIANISPDVQQRIADDCQRFQLSEHASALLGIARRLQHDGYRFTAVTPETQAAVNARPANRTARDLRDVFGWNRPFYARDLPPAVVDELVVAGALDQLHDGRLRSRIRFSTIADLLILHDGAVPGSHDTVEFGPDSYRFVRLLRSALPEVAGGEGSLLEIGAGTGAASLCLRERFDRLVMTDINAKAVRYAQLNAILAGCEHAETACGHLAGGVSGRFEAVVANPPYVIDPAGRWYRDGSDLGIGMAARMLEAGLPRLAPTGRLVLYAVTAVIDGTDRLRALLTPTLEQAGLPWRYEEVDVDVVVPGLTGPAYEHVERIAMAAVVVGPGTETRQDDNELCVLWGPFE